MLDRRYDYSCSPRCHIHEFTGNVRIAGWDENSHNHHFAGTSGQAIPIKGGSHIHELCAKTDFYDNHLHLIDVKSGPAIPVGGGRHVHFVAARTKAEEGHEHEFIVATLIENPNGLY